MKYPILTLSLQSMLSGRYKPGTRSVLRAAHIHLLYELIGATWTIIGQSKRFCCTNPNCIEKCREKGFPEKVNEEWFEKAMNNPQVKRI